MVARERDLARSGEVEVVGGEVVDLVRVLAEKAGAGHDLGANERRRDERDEVLGERLVERHVHQGEFEPGADAAEKVATETSPI